MGLTRPTISQMSTSLTEFADPLVTLQKDASGTNNVDIGFIFDRGADTNVGLIWDESADKFAIINTTETGSTVGNVAISSYSDLQVATLTASSLVSGAFTLPGTDGTNGQVLVTDGSGTVTWADPSGGIALTDLSASGSLSYDNTTGVFSYTQPTNVSTFTNDSGYLIASDISGKADLASPALTGTPTAPTAAAGTNTTQLATTAFVGTAVANLVDSAPGTLDTLNELAAALDDDPNFATTITNSIATKLSLSGGTMTGDLTISKTDAALILSDTSGAPSDQSIKIRAEALDVNLPDGGTHGLVIEDNSGQGYTTDVIATGDFFANSTNKVWNAGNDGAGSGLDADTLDSLEATSFLRSDASDSTTGQLTVNNSSAYDTEGNFVVYGTGKNSLIVQTSENTSDRGLAFRNSGGAYISYINIADRGSNLGDMVFGVSSATRTNVDDIEERMRITKEGNIVSAGGEFQGLATSAQYADLAENYLADQAYPVGTVLQIGGDAEVTLAEPGSWRIAGTVSDKPGFIMNSKLEGEYVTPVAYIGRVPCRVKGTIERGDLLIVSDIPGVATAINPTTHHVLPGEIIGKSLEAYNSDNEGTVEIMIGRI